MLMLGRMLTMAVALLGGIFFSQAPEFAQQYRQRIGGALDELRAVIAQFDNEANRNGLDREKALGLYSISPERFLRAQGGAMRHNFDRYSTLEQQSLDLQAAAPIAKPFVLLRNPDPDLITNAWRDFNPGIPVTMAGLAWAAVGLVVGWLVAALFGAASLRSAGRHHVKRGPRRKDMEYATTDQALRRQIDNAGLQPVDVIHQAEHVPEHSLPERLPSERSWDGVEQSRPQAATRRSLPREVPHQPV